MRCAVAVLLFVELLAAEGDSAPKLEPVGAVVLRSGAVMPQVRFSSDGRWMVAVGTVREDKARHSWTYREHALVDLSQARAAKPVPTSLGRNSPVFSRNARWLAWCDGPAADRLTVYRRELATGKSIAVPIALPPFGRGFATVCAIDNDGRRVVVAVPGRGRGRPPQELAIVDLETKKVLSRHADFKEPYFSSINYAVTLHGDLLLHHSRPPGATSGASYMLLLSDTRKSEVRGSFGAYVACDTPRYHLLRDGLTLLNGTGDWDVLEIDASTGDSTPLFNAYEALYSHFFELTMSPDERYVIAWSRARTVLACWDRRAKQRFDIPYPEHTRGLLGVCVDNRHALLHDQKGVALIDLKKRAPAKRLCKGKWQFAGLDPTGTRLVLGSDARKSREWRIEVFKIRTAAR
jgi:hypothetical protein